MRGHHLPANEERLRLFGGHHGPVHPQGAGANTLEAEFCLEALNEAIHKFGPREIMNTDQGSQFTSFNWTDRLKRAKTKILMDSKVRYLDNIFIERLWRSLKYECVYLHAWESGL